MRIVVGLAAFALASCTHAAQPFTTPDGKPAWLVRCGGAMRTMTACHEIGRKVCRGNYTVLNQVVTPRATDDFATENRSIEIVCESHA
jgi:hypothetical protein